MKNLIFLVVLFFSIATFGAKKYRFVEIETNVGTIKVKLYTNTPKHSEQFLKLAKKDHYDGLLFHRVIKDFMIQGGASDSKGATAGKIVGGSDLDYTIESEFMPENRHIKGALAAARQGDNINPEKRSSAEQFYFVQGETYTDVQLNQLEKQKLGAAKNKLGGQLYKSYQQEHTAYVKSGQGAKADSLISLITTKIEEKFTHSNPYKFTPEVRELYKSVGGTPFLDGDYTVFGEIVEGMDVLDKIAKVQTDKNDRPLEDVVILSTKFKRK